MASRSEVMLPPAGSEARWREEVMPGRSSGEAMLALTHQEAKTKKRASKLK
ncbi:hydrolase-like protein [Mesotoga prima]|uniref:hydrolase-like protein n=1 Tax=Mesotoga prima TaxID=1184387 RepID=UPI002B932BDC|nr:hydrolase-like protein [Mesotoga prima]HQC14000.1 hydrolase-like protein [Mesotoga prima]